MFILFCFCPCLWAYRQAVETSSTEDFDSTNQYGFSVADSTVHYEIATEVSSVENPETGGFFDLNLDNDNIIDDDDHGGATTGQYETEYSDADIEIVDTSTNKNVDVKQLF